MWIAKKKKVTKKKKVIIIVISVQKGQHYLGKSKVRSRNKLL